LNEHERLVFYGRHSVFATWLADPAGPVRTRNYSDILVREALSACHDYFHAWGFALVNDVVPEIGYGTAPITRETLDDHAFCHMVIESAAVVGLEYWYLSTLDLEDLCDIGTTVSGVTVDFHERYMGEYRRFCPGLVVQAPAFFETFAKFYLTGQFEGFTGEALARSPRLHAWLGKELAYESRQRGYCREWLASLAAEEIAVPSDRRNAAISVDRPWKRKLVAEMRDALWEKVKHGHRHSFRRTPAREEVWKAPLGRRPDFRFVNVRRLSSAERRALDDAGPFAETEFRYFLNQLVSGCVYGSFDHELVKLFEPLVAKRDFGLVFHLLRNQPRVTLSRREPRAIFVPG
jgi:hypothetical protein